jgi:hypothetical protein
MSYTSEKKEPEPVMHAPVEGAPSYAGSQRKGFVSDDIYPGERRSAERGDSLKKNDVESNESDIKIEQGMGDSDVLSDEDKPGKIKMFVAAYAKEIRVAIHAAIAIVMTG